MKKTNIIITDKAVSYLKSSLESENNVNIIIYVSVAYPLTKDAYVNITYCKKTDLNIEDTEITFNNLAIYIEKKSVSLLNQSIIDFKNEHLSINAPHIYTATSNGTKDTKEKIKQLFENEINVILSQHGGFIELVDIINDETLTVKFHGGCQGCGMISYTLNNYIEKIIKNNFPKIKNIDDITQHEIKNNSYY